MKINTFIPDKHKYLQRLFSIAQMPKILYAKGILPEREVATVAVVGTRSPTPYGKQVAFDFAYRLAREGIVIVSGLAYGIDRVAHEAALEAGGTTIAVLAHGLDTIYPSRHQTLAKRILDNRGALISEYPVGTPAQKHRFLERNGIVSGLADALVVIEAGERSGTSVTVMHALEQGKEVFAVPGPITSPQSVGPNRLIQQGAHPAVSVEDILRVVAPGKRTHTKSVIQGNSPEENIILGLIRNGMQDSDGLLKASGLSVQLYLQTLTLLEINGLIRSIGPHRFTYT